MRTATFVKFVSASALTMLLLIALPLAGVLALAMHRSFVRTKIVEVKQEVPVFGGLSQTQIRKVPQPVLDEHGKPIKVWEFVGGANLYKAAEIDGLASVLSKDRSGQSLPEAIASMYQEVTNYDFWGALEFTLVYTAISTPIVLTFGIMLALSVNAITERWRGTVISAILLPMVITPVVAALALYWLFLDNAVIAASLESLGLGHIYFLKDAITIRSLIILFSVWNATPFAFIIFYAGLQTVPREPLEAAMVDGASRLAQLRYVILPYLMPQIVVITLTHLMDSYRVFEPILVFGSSVFATSLQYLVYFVLSYNDNVHMAAAHAVLTVIGIVILLIPVLVRTWREQQVA